MKSSLIFVLFFVTNIFCEDAHEDIRLENKAIEPTNNQHNSPLLSEINDSLSPENPLAVKQKRCLKFSSPLLGASKSPKAEKDDNKNKLYSALCRTCLITNKCSSVNECPLCQKWCTTSKNCKEDDDKNKEEDETVSLGTRGNFNTDDDKSKVRSITLTGGNLMEIILSLFGIYDAKDVESVTVTVKSSGDSPIELSEKDLQEQGDGGKLEKKLKDLGAIGRQSEVDENPIERDKLHELVTEILDKLRSRDVSPLKGNELADDEIPQVGSRMRDVESRDKIIHQSISNPDIIEDSPDMARISSNSGLLASPSKHQENLGVPEEDTKNPTLGASLSAPPGVSPSSNLDSTQDIQLGNRNNDEKLRDPIVPPHHIHHPHHIQKPPHIPHRPPHKPHIHLHPPHKPHSIPHHPPHFPQHVPPHFHRSNEPTSNFRYAPDSYQNFYPRYAPETSEPFQRPDMPLGNPRYIPDGSQNFYGTNEPAGNLRYASQYYDNTVGAPYNQNLMSNPNNQALRSSMYNYPDNFVGQPFYPRQPEVDSRLGYENPQVSNHPSPAANHLPPNPFANDINEEVLHKEQDHQDQFQAVSEAAKKPKIGAARSSEPVKVDLLDKQAEPKKAIGFKASEMMRKLKERQDQTMQRFEDQKSRLRENADKVTKPSLKEDIPKTLASKAASKIKKTGEDVVGSQPLENFFQRMQPDNTFLHRPWSKLKNTSPSENSPNPDSNFGVERRVGSPTPNLSSRSHLEDESNALGGDISYKNPSDIFFVGNGVKLPLQMVKKSDGAVHLAVDMDKLCTSCHNNRTAKQLESTVEAILEKEAELKDQLQDITRKQRNFEGSEFVNIKNRIANRYKDGSSLKRSIKDDQNLPNFLKDLINKGSKKGTVGTTHSIFHGKTLEDTNENLIPISSSYKFEGLEEDLAKKLKNIEKTVENYSKIDDRIFENESEILNKFNEDNPLVQKEIELVSDLLGFFKKLAVDATKQKDEQGF